VFDGKEQSASVRRNDAAEREALHDEKHHKPAPVACSNRRVDWRGGRPSMRISFPVLFADLTGTIKRSSKRRGGAKLRSSHKHECEIIGKTVV
jgi:hypothetical protein